MNNDLTDNDLKRFNKLFTTFHERFISFAYSYIGDMMVAEDIVMESMMAYWENRNSLDCSSPDCYIVVTIKNKCLNYLRSKLTHESVSDELLDHYEWKLNLEISSLEACEPTELYNQEIRDAVEIALGKLPETTRKIFEMRRFEGLSYRDISLKTGLSVKGIEYHMTKATKALREFLKYYLIFFILIQK